MLEGLRQSRGSTGNATDMKMSLDEFKTLIKSGKAGSPASKSKTGKRRGHAYVSKAQMAEPPAGASDKI